MVALCTLLRDAAFDADVLVLNQRRPRYASAAVENDLSSRYGTVIEGEVPFLQTILPCFFLITFFFAVAE